MTPRHTKTDPLPLLPSGPGGVRGESLHRARSSTDRQSAQQNFLARKTASRSLAQRHIARKPPALHPSTGLTIASPLQSRTTLDFQSSTGVPCGARNCFWKGSHLRCIRKHRRDNLNPANPTAERRSPAIKSAASGLPGAAGRSTAWTPSSTPSSSFPHCAICCRARASPPPRKHRLLRRPAVCSFPSRLGAGFRLGSDSR